MRKKLLQPDGSPRPKGKPRGNPSKIIPYQIKPGEVRNPGGRSKATRVSEAVAQELSRTKNGTDSTRAGILASNLLDRAEKDSVELERVIKISEPGLLQEQGGQGSQNIVIGFKYGGKENDGNGAQLDHVQRGSNNGDGSGSSS